MTRPAHEPATIIHSLLMARICFDRDDADSGVAALRETGFTVLTHVFEEEPDHIFVEASREVDTTVESALFAVIEIVEPFGGFVADVGVVPPGHVPFEYERSAAGRQS
jgi:hypothetical protein